MIGDVLELLDGQPALWSGDAAADPAVEEYRTAVEEATEIDRERNALGTKGLTVDKQARRDEMEARLLAVFDAPAGADAAAVCDAFLGAASQGTARNDRLTLP